MQRLHLAPIVAGVCVVALSACGSSGPSSAAASGSPNPQFQKDALKMSQCMRASGVPNFPDPNSSGGIDIGQTSGLDPRSPAFQAATAKCSKLLPGGGPGSHPIPPAQRRELIAQSQCMRTHGVPNYPDPQFGAGTVKIGFGPNAGIDPSSPVFQQAQKTCALLGPKGKGPKGGGNFAFRIAG